MRDERGYTLTEVLVAMTGMLLVFGAALSILGAVERNSRSSDLRSDDQRDARVAVERLSRDLRNLASPTYEMPVAVNKVSNYDIVFLTVDPTWRGSLANPSNVERVRYCLDAPNARVVRQEQRWTTSQPPAMPSTDSCSLADAGWEDAHVVARNVRNRKDGQDRPVFLFNGSGAVDVTRVRVQLYVNADRRNGPKETPLSSGVYLRNQNAPPTASFTYTISGRQIILNAAASADPEGEPLTYVWFDGAVKIGEGVTFGYVPPRDGSATRYISLKVYDPAGLEGSGGTQAVTVG